MSNGDLSVSLTTTRNGEIVELHGGNITVTSEVDHGSCFIILLPSIKKHDYHQ